MVLPIWSRVRRLPLPFEIGLAWRLRLLAAPGVSLSGTTAASDADSR
jgi:hypothetical protein